VLEKTALVRKSRDKRFLHYIRDIEKFDHRKPSNSLDNVCFLNYASFIEWQNPMYNSL